MNCRASIGLYILSIYFAFVAGGSNLPRNNPHIRRASSARLPFPEEQERRTIDVSFNLYTKKNRWRPQSLKIETIDSVRNSSFANSDSTIFVTHGRGDSSIAPLATAVLRYAYLNGEESLNVIEVQWSSRTVSSYRQSLKAAQTVGSQVARMIDFLKCKAQLNLDSTTLVGHSVGAHIMGIAGRKVSTGRVNQIFALDPARAHFDKPGRDKLRLSTKSARNVQVIHTNGNQRGLLDPLGHADFYPNGGSQQPGCVNINPSRKAACSHYVSFWLLAESLNSPTGFKALRCRPGENALKGQCGGKVVLMGGRSNHIDATGSYYLETADELPYALELRRDKNQIYRFIKKNQRSHIAEAVDLAYKSLI